jgi:hypothetical protein
MRPKYIKSNNVKLKIKRIKRSYGNALMYNWSGIRNIPSEFIKIYLKVHLARRVNKKFKRKTKLNALNLSFSQR